MYPAGKGLETLALHGLIARIGLDQPEVTIAGDKQIGGELAIVGGLLDDNKVLGSTKIETDLAGEVGQKATIQRANANRSVKIARSSDAARPGAVVAVVRMIQSEVHDPGEIQPATRSGAQGSVEEVGKRGHGKGLAGGQERH